METATKYKTADLEGALLDAAVAECRRIAGDFYRWELIPEDKSPIGRVYCSVDAYNVRAAQWEPSTDWCDGGPLIERERIELMFGDEEDPGRWSAYIRPKSYAKYRPWLRQGGPTPLIAAMRAYVAIKIGEEVSLP